MNNERAKLMRFTTAQKQACTVHVRLTPELKDALRNAKAAGHSISVRLGNDYNKTALTVGHQEFQLTATDDGKSGLAAFLHGFDAGSECTEIGSVMHKLHVQKTMDNIDRGRIRASAEEVERKQRERRAVVMNTADMPGGRTGATTTTITTTTTTRTAASAPRPSSSGLPPKPLAVPGAPRPSRAASPSPSPHPMRPLEPPKPGALKAKAQQAARSKRTPPPSQPRQTPPPPADTLRQQEDSRHQRASAGGSSSPRGAPAEDVPPAMLAAARNNKLRHCVAAALSNRPLSRVAVLEQVRGAYSQAGVRCPEEEAITEALRRLASRDPSSSLYNLRPEHRSKAPPSGHSPPAPQQDRPLPAPQPPKRRAQDPFGDLEDPSSPHRPSQPPPPPKRSRPSQSPAPPSSQPSTKPQQPPQAHPAAENGQSFPAAAASKHHNAPILQRDTEPTPPPPPIKLPPTTSHQPPAHPTIKLPPRRLAPPSLTPPSDSTHHLSNGHHMRPSQSNAPPPGPPPSSAQQSPYSAGTSDTGPSTLGSDQRPFPAAAAPPAAASSASVVVPEVDPDEGEYTEFIGREAVLLGEIGSQQQLDAAQKAYMRKWGIYFSLSKKIEDFQNEMNAFWKAAQECGDAQERGRLEEVLREAALRKGRMSNRWNDAFQVLHKELVSIRQVAEEYGTRAGLLPGHPAAN